MVNLSHILFFVEHLVRFWSHFKLHLMANKQFRIYSSVIICRTIYSRNTYSRIFSCCLSNPCNDLKWIWRIICWLKDILMIVPIARMSNCFITNSITFDTLKSFLSYDTEMDQDKVEETYL